MRPSDLIKIIEACKVANVLKIRVGELELDFATGEAAQNTRLEVESNQPPTDQELKEAEAEAAAAQTTAERDDDLALMQIEDPVRFEELLVQREFEVGETAFD